MCTTCNTNCNSICPPTPCACKVFLSSDCIDNVTEDLTCSNILKGQTLTETLVLLDAYICERFESVTSFFDLINVGTGAEIYKGVSILGKKELKTLLDSNLINLTEGTNEITISVDETALNTFIEANQKTYSAVNIGTGAQVYKNSTVVGDNTQFNLRKIKSSDSSVTITEGTDDIDVTITVDTVITDGSLNPISSNAVFDALATGVSEAKYEAIVIPISDLITNLTTGVTKGYFPMPFSAVVNSVKANVLVPQTAGSILTFDINENGVSILSTKLTIDNNEKTSLTASTPSVITDTTLSADSEITFDIDQIGTVGAKGAVITLIVTRI